MPLSDSVREQVMQAVETAVAGVSGMGATTRVAMLPQQLSMPGAVIYEPVERKVVRGPMYAVTMDLRIQVWVYDDTENSNKDLTDLMELVEEAMVADRTLGGLSAILDVDTTAALVSVESKYLVGTMRATIRYRHSIDDPTATVAST